MTPHEKSQLIKLLRDAVEAVGKIPPARRCVDCLMFSQGFCSYWQENVPEEFIEVGCDEWAFDVNSPPF